MRSGSRSEWLPHAIQSSVRLENEPKPDTTGNKPLIIEITGTVTEISKTDGTPFEFRVNIFVSDTEQHTLFFVMPPKFQLPMETGQVIRLRYLFQKHPKSKRITRAVVIQDDKKELIFLLQDESLIPPTWLPAFLNLRTDKTIAYTEAGRLSGMCYGVIEHRLLRLGGGLGDQELQPGEHAQVSIGSERFQVIALDHAVTLRSDCKDFGADRKSWMAIRLPSTPELQ
ncbi:MAG TPA: hypothetical protein EYN06_10005 [Myxococcales bacterium]|nr:hypothetical protein [Myxococcales bacterium]